MADPLPTVPVEVGRDNYVDGAQGANTIYSEVRVINITPYEVNEIKTSVITLEQDAFPVTTPGSQNTPQISVCSVDVTAGYVQWEPMGLLHAATPSSPLGSYKHLRVKWDCYLPAGSDEANYTKLGAIEGPYDHYAEKIYAFRALEPATDPQFTLTPAVVSALGGNECDIPMHFEFSAHGYVNKFNFANGLYGQDKQADIPDGSALLPAKREPIYDRYFLEQGDVNEPPLTVGTTCLAKEYMVHGRIVPELDFDGAAFEIKQEGNTLPGSEAISSYGLSGRDAPPFWYNLHYELQHEKNIIPFTFIWGVGMLTYDAGPEGSRSNSYDPRGPVMDLPDVHGRLGPAKGSSNQGPRLRSFGAPGTWVETVKQYNTDEGYTPNIFWSDDDITFSVVGPDVVCHASSVNVCAVYTDTVNSLKRTILNWFDKSNQTFYDVEIYGYNCLPYSSTWVLRGCLHINENYLPAANLSTRDSNAQLSNQLERTWAIDLNFSERNLFTCYKSPIKKPPEDYITRFGHVDAYQTAAFLANDSWDDTVTVDIGYVPRELAAQENQANGEYNPYWRQPDFETNKQIGFLKNLKEPWAMSPFGLAARAGIAGGQPGFTVLGAGATLAGAGLPDGRALEAATDLEWMNRLSMEAGREGKIIDHFDTAWIAKRQIPAAPTLNFPVLNDAVRTLTNNPSYTGWLNKSINDPEFQGAQTLLDNTTILGYYGTNVAWSGEDAVCKFNRGANANLHGGSNNKFKIYGHATFNRLGRLAGNQYQDHFVSVSLTDLTKEDESLGICVPDDVTQRFAGLTFNSSEDTFYSISNDSKRPFTVSATNGSSLILSGETQPAPDSLPYNTIYGTAYNPLDDKIYGLGVKNLEKITVNGEELIPYEYYIFKVNPANGAFLEQTLFDTDIQTEPRDSRTTGKYRGIAFKPNTNELYGIRLEFNPKKSFITRFNSTFTSFTDVIETGYEEIFDIEFSNATDIYTASRIFLGGREYEQPLIKVDISTGTISVIRTLPRSEITGGRVYGICFNDLTGDLRIINGRNEDRFEPRNNYVGYPTPKHQYAKGYPGNGSYYSGTKREGFTPSHSAHGNLISYAMISGDLVTIKLVEYHMRVLMSSHNDGEHARQLFFPNGEYPVKWRNAGRMEGRPLHGLVMGLSVSRDRVLRERAICSLSRRFFNLYNVQEFELSPTGVPGKPWISLWYPPWAGGRWTDLDSNGHPVYTFAQELKNESEYFKNYYANYAQAGNFAQRLYNMQGIPLSAIAGSTFNRDRAAVWHWHDVPQKNSEIYNDSYNEMYYIQNPLAPDPRNPTDPNRYGFLKERSIFFKELGYREGNPNRVKIDYLAYRVSHNDHPLRTHIIAPDVTGALNNTSALPSVTGIPLVDRDRNRLKDFESFYFSTQGYQQGLLYPFISPIVDIFYEYSTIFQERAALGQTPDFVAKFDNYNQLYQELADAHEYSKQYMVRVAKTIANMLLIPIASNSPRAAGRYALTYFLASYSKAKPFEWFINSENEITIGTNGSGNKPVVAVLDGINKYMYSSYVLGGYYSGVNRFNGPSAGNGFGTIGWAFTAVVWAWDILYRYADLTDPVNFESIEKLKQNILDQLGPVPFDNTQVNNDKMFRTTGNLSDCFYGRLYGSLGWPGFGSGGPKLSNKLGDSEALPWWQGSTADSLWADRTIDLTLKVLSNLKVEGSTTVSAQEIVVTRDRQTHVIEASSYTGSSTLSSNVRRIRTYKPIPRDEGNESYYPNIAQPTVINIPGTGGRVTYFFTGQIAGSTAVSANSLVLSSFVTGDYLGSTLLSSEVILPGVIEGNLAMSSTYDVDYIAVGQSFGSLLITSGSSDLSSDNFDVYIRLPDPLISGVVDLSANSLSVARHIPGSVSFSGFSSSALVKQTSLLSPGGISGQINLIAEIDTLSLECVITGETSLDAEFEYVFDNTIRGQSQQDSLVVTNDRQLETSSYQESFSRYSRTGLARNQIANFEKKLFHELMQRSKADAKVTEIYRQTLQTLISSFSQFVYKNDENKIVKVPCWHGTSERVVAKIKQESNIILPVISVYRLGNKNDETRRRTSSLIVYDKYWDVEKQRAVRVARLAPTPVNITYKLNVWTKYQEDMDHLTEQIHRLFNPDLEIITQYNTTTKAFLIEESENTETDLPDGQERVIRKVFTIDIQSYIPNPRFLITHTGKIEEFKAELYTPIK